MTLIELFYKDKEYIELKRLVLGGESAKLELLKDRKIAILSFSPSISIIDKKIAERLAQSICKTGFLLESGERVGIGYTLEMKTQE